MSPTTEQVQQLMQIGFIAAGNGFDSDAETIFQGLKAVRPDSELPWVGHGFILMNRGRLAESINMLREACAKNPDSEFAMSFLGAALKLAGLNRAASEALEHVSSEGEIPEAVDFAKMLLQNPGESREPNGVPTQTLAE